MPELGLDRQNVLGQTGCGGADLEAKIAAARGCDAPSVIDIDIAPYSGTGAGGYW